MLTACWQLNVLCLVRALNQPYVSRWECQVIKNNSCKETLTKLLILAR